MLAIGRDLMMRPKLLILDEPTLGLAPVAIEQLSKALDELRRTTSLTLLLGEQHVKFALPPLTAFTFSITAGSPGTAVQSISQKRGVWVIFSPRNNGSHVLLKRGYDRSSTDHRFVRNRRSQRFSGTGRSTTTDAPHLGARYSP